ncbi:MAG: peptidoglycan-binding protein, partial [Firmicutes bacterium]|nr:peptidoglycan-binding protein [Bacillota bacterium]
MKRIALFILVTLLCMAIVLSAFAGEWLPVVAALRTNANLRAAPSAEAKSKMILMKGTQVTVVRVEGTWLEVRYGNYSGYIRGDLVEGDIPYGALPGPAEKPVVISSGTDTRPVLRMGMRGVEVYDLQAFLLALGFDIGKPDGIFGETTKEAVREFQWEYGLPADGVVGKDTYDRMEYALAGGVPAGAPTGAYAPQATVGLQASAVPPAVITRTLKNGVTGGDVLLLNQRLETLGYVSYATNTYNTAAVKAFQQRNGLVADGIAGSKTQSVLFSGWAIAAPGIPLPAASPAAGPSAPVNRVLRAGMTGSDVLAVNQRLEQLGYISAAASVYMESAVTAFQARNGLPADGVIGAATLNRLYSSSAVGMPSGAQPAAMPQPVSTQYAFTRTLYAGMTGPDVLALNERLVSLGYLVNSANLYDASAVRAFQQRNGLVADGIAGPLTVGRLFSAVAVSAATPVVSQGSGAGSLQYGDRGEAVRTLQRALRQTGYYTEGIDGDFGAATRMAVGLFQKTNGLSETGVADAQTQALLYGGRAQPAPV